MKINSTIFTIIVISLVAFASYYLGVSGRNSNQAKESPPTKDAVERPNQEQSVTSNSSPAATKQTEAKEAKSELNVPKWEYGWLLMSDCCKWQDADQSVFSCEKEDFYRKMGLPSNAMLQDLLNLLGTQGWELVNVSVKGTQQDPAFWSEYDFKRPK